MCLQTIRALPSRRGRVRYRDRRQEVRRNPVPRPVETNRTAPVQHLPIPFFRTVALGVAILASSLTFAPPARAESALVVEADTGKVLYAENPTYPWYPASTSKLMTMYLTLRAVKDHRLNFDSMVTVSP